MWAPPPAPPSPLLSASATAPASWCAGRGGRGAGTEAAVWARTRHPFAIALTGSLLASPLFPNRPPLPCSIGRCERPSPSCEPPILCCCCSRMLLLLLLPAAAARHLSSCQPAVHPFPLPHTVQPLPPRPAARQGLLCPLIFPAGPRLPAGRPRAQRCVGWYACGRVAHHIPGPWARGLPAWPLPGRPTGPRQCGPHCRHPSRPVQCGPP